jgi:hypothetical protein
MKLTPLFELYKEGNLFSLQVRFFFPPSHRYSHSPLILKQKPGTFQPRTINFKATSIVLRLRQKRTAMSQFTYLKKHLQASTSHAPQPAPLQTPTPTPEDFAKFLNRIFANMPEDSTFVIGQGIKEIAREPQNATSGHVLVLLARNLVKVRKKCQD